MIGLPSLHASDHSHGPRIWLAADATNMRSCFDRLAERLKSVEPMVHVTHTHWSDEQANSISLELVISPDHGTRREMLRPF
jgi:hypothetical protein